MTVPAAPPRTRRGTMLRAVHRRRRVRRTAAVALAGLLALPVVQAAPASAATCDDACKVAGARAYVEALASHDPSDVPFHPRATRVEAGLQTGFSGDQLRVDLRHGPQYRVIRGIEDASFAVGPDGVVVADFGLDVGLPGVGLGRARVHETFAFDEEQPRLIRRIEADIALTELVGLPVPQDAS